MLLYNKLLVKLLNMLLAMPPNMLLVKLLNMQLLMR
jgi:hypothetical protein